MVFNSLIQSMKIRLFSFLGVCGTLLFVSQTSHAAVTLTCQNYSSSKFLCVHSLMPIMSQGDTSNGQELVNGVWVQKYGKNRYNYSAMLNKTSATFSNYTMGLLEYVNVRLSAEAGTAYKQTLTWDPGWCGGTSSAINMRTYSLESGNKTVSNGVNLGGTSVNAFIYQVFKLVQTNIARGGTFIQYMTSGFNKIKPGMAVSTSVVPNQVAYAKSMPLQSMSVCNGSYGCHIISLYGMEGSNYVILDPWGSIYTVSYNPATYQMNFLAYESKNVYGGFIPNYGKVAKYYGSTQISGYAPVAAKTVIASATTTLAETSCDRCTLP